MWVGFGITLVRIRGSDHTLHPAFQFLMFLVFMALAALCCTITAWTSPETKRYRGAVVGVNLSFPAFLALSYLARP